MNHDFVIEEAYKDKKFIGTMYKCKCGKEHFCSDGIAVAPNCYHTQEFYEGCNFKEKI